MSDVLGSAQDVQVVPITSGTVIAKMLDELQSGQAERREQMNGRIGEARSELVNAESALSGTAEDLAAKAAQVKDMFPARKQLHLHGALDGDLEPHDTPASVDEPTSWSAFTESVNLLIHGIAELNGKLVVWDSEWSARAKTVRNRFEGAKWFLRHQRERVATAKTQLERELGEAERLEANFKKEVLDLLKTVAGWRAYVADELREIPWDDPTWKDWKPTDSMPSVMRIGEYVTGGRPTQRELRGIGIPALIEFPGPNALVIHKGGCAEQAEALMSSVLLRLIAYSQPGAYKITFIDPVGLGGSFAPFLHFNEFDESVLTGRAVSQANDINAVLDELLVHIETVTQQYLRSSYATLAEYNEAAGTIAERYRYLAVADFPSSFDARASEKLRSIMQRGPRCGVYTIVTGNDGQSNSTSYSDVIGLSRLDPGATSIYAGSGANPEREYIPLLDPDNVADLANELTADREADSTAAQSLDGDPWLDADVPIRITGGKTFIPEALAVAGNEILELDEPLFLICDFAVDDADALQQALAASEDDDAVVVLVSPQVNEQLIEGVSDSRFVAIAPPSENCEAGEFFADLALQTGATLLTSSAEVAAATDASLGGAARIAFTDRTTLIEDPDGDTEDLKARRNQLRAEFENAEGRTAIAQLRARWNKEYGAKPRAQTASGAPAPRDELAEIGGLRSEAHPSTAQATLGGIDTGRLQLAIDSPPELVLKEDGDQGLFGRILVGAAVTGKKSVSKLVTQGQSFDLMAQSRAWREQTGTDHEFAVTVPANPDTWWQADSLENIVTPLGRAGARDACCIGFDSELLTSAIVIGTTGSGKSSLLHSFILGSCIQYSPDELELYLLDSKQGVEFKVYEDLPHARAVAIRNEREFGVSVLEGLRAEIDRRAAKIKGNTGGAEVGLPGYRRATREKLPRVILVADEFHELFESSDQLGRRAAELLDDLIRQGRSYGVHVILGSQTLDGAEALPRHSIGLIQTRIAFACREQDADFIMTEENREVKTLSNVGDGVLNPSRGNPDKNVRFQGAYIAPDERVELVKALRKHSEGRFDRSPIVFDGDAAAELDTIAPDEFAAEQKNATTLSLRIGEPCAISGSVVAELPRRPGANIAAIVEEEGETPLIHTLLGTVAWGETRCQATVIDFSGTDDAAYDAFKEQDSIRMVRRRQAGPLMAELNALVEERVELEDYKAAPRLLILTGLKGLRNVTEDIADGESFESMLNRIATDGPEVGVHVVLIGDTLKTIERRVDRGTLGEFAVRIASRMGEDDSRNWIESDAATSLRPQQGLIWDDANGEIVRFKRYEKAGDRWISALQTNQPAGVTSDE